MSTPIKCLIHFWPTYNFKLRVYFNIFVCTNTCHNKNLIAQINRKLRVIGVSSSHQGEHLGVLTHLDDLCLSLVLCVDHLCSSILGALTHHNGRGGQCTMKCSAPTVLFRHNGLKMFVTQATMASQSGHLGYLLLLIHQTPIV